jgi:hypothetical protein
VEACLSFSWLHCCYIVFHSSSLYSYWNSSRTLSIKSWDSAIRTEFQRFILRFPYFVDTNKSRVGAWKTGWRQGDFTDIFIKLNFCIRLHQCGCELVIRRHYSISPYFKNV